MDGGERQRSGGEGEFDRRHLEAAKGRGLSRPRPRQAEGSQEEP